LSPLENDVAAFFDAAGPLARGVLRFAERGGQLDMALAVARAIDRHEALVVEAGTGVGKTYAYLAPALLSGGRTLISTATKALQDQLFGRDLPAVCRALGLPVRTALLKGRSSYLCQHRLEQARYLLEPHERYLHQWLDRIEAWSRQTQTGDMAEVPGLDDRAAIVPLVTSTRENCLGTQCPQFRACHVNQVRREAMAADVVVVNHHLFFADVAVRESGVAELLPTVELVVFDEAHQLNEIGVQFLGVQVSSGHLLDLARDTLAHGLQAARGLRDWSALAGGVERATQDLRLAVGADRRSTGKRRWHEAVPEGVAAAEWMGALDGLADALDHLCDGLHGVEEHSPDLARVAQRAQELAQRLQAIREPEPDARVARWVELGAGLRLVLTPLDIADAFQTKVLARDGARSTTWVFTSATLGNDDALSWFTEPVGLRDARTLRVASPFDYAAQAAVFVPPRLPAPSDPGHTDAVAHAAWGWAQRIGGRTLVLTTTLRAVKRIADAMTGWAQAQAGAQALEVLVQGQSPKRELLRQFERAGLPGARGAVLVASASFWEGVDVPGDALQLVVIDKLPFPPPDDPLVEARTRQIEHDGGSAFTRYFLPEAAVALKQGAGRLIRSEHDRGVLVVCDVRLRRMGYGRKLLGGLPPMRWVEDDEAMWSELDALVTTASTTAHPSA
jgi:ATP-dependent DNA helicase DinG